MCGIWICPTRTEDLRLANMSKECYQMSKGIVTSSAGSQKMERVGGR